MTVGSASGPQVGSPRLWIRAQVTRPLLVAHLGRVAAAFAAEGWRILGHDAMPGTDRGALAVLIDPWSEPTPELALQLAQARGPAAWRVPRVLGLSGEQGWTPRVPPWTRWEYRRSQRRTRGLRAVPFEGSAWLGFAVAPGSLDLASPELPVPDPDDAVGLVREAVLFRHADPADHERPELDELIPTGARVIVDVGCGKGRVGARLRRADRTVIGVEPDGELAAAARAVLDEVIEADAAAALAALPAAVDCFLFADVLEHMVDPAAVLAAARRHLAAGGVIVASVPNAAFAPVLRAAVAGRWDTTLAGVQAHDHLFCTTPDSFGELAAGCGLAVVERHPLTVPLSWSTRLWARVASRSVGGSPKTLAAPQWLFVLRAT